MTTEYSFKFKELVLDYSSIIKSLGYKGLSLEELPEPFGSYIEEAINECDGLNDIKGTFIVTEVKLEKSKSSVFVGEIEFKVGRVIRGELEGATSLAFFVCTAGVALSDKIKLLLLGDDPVLGYVYNLVGDAITEAVGDKIHAFIETEAGNSGLKITNRYSPGYCHWNVSEQHNLFKLMGGNPCGVRLNASSLMNPIKSISGVVGIGEFVNYRDYQCELCQMKNCFLSGKNDQSEHPITMQNDHL